MAPMRAFSILQKWPKMTSDDLLILEMVFTEPPRNTKQSFCFLKFIISVELEQKSDCSGNIASHESKANQIVAFNEPISDED